LEKAPGGQNIWRAYSKHKGPEQNPRKTEYLEGLLKGLRFLTTQNPRRTDNKESFLKGETKRGTHFFI
jgi:hypothetical protein